MAPLSISLGDCYETTRVSEAAIVLRHVGSVRRPVARDRHRSSDRGASAYFTHVNRAGGVRGRKIVLKTYDDGYQPDPSVANTLTLFEDQVVAQFTLDADRARVLNTRKFQEATSICSFRSPAASRSERGW